jgi:hypothetical protein
MQSSEENALRLLTALETLVAEEECAVRSSEFERTLEVQQRAEPVIVRLTELLKDPALPAEAPSSLQPRLTALRARRAASLGVLSSRLVEMRASLATLDAARVQLGDLKSAYGVNRRMHRGTPAGLNLSA